MPRAMEAFVRKTFPDCRFFHLNTALMEGIRKLADIKEGPQVYAHIRNGTLSIFAFEGKNLLFSNIFPYQSAKDFIYFLLLFLFHF